MYKKKYFLLFLSKPITQGTDFVYSLTFVFLKLTAGFQESKAEKVSKIPIDKHSIGQNAAKNIFFL